MSYTTLFSPGRYTGAERAAVVGLTGLIPLSIVTALVLGGTHRAGQLLAVFVGLVLIALVAHWPLAGTGFLLIWMPTSQVVLALLLRFGLPAGAVRAGGSIKDLVILGLIVAAVTRGGRDRFDLLDKLALALVVLLAAYIVVPPLAAAGTTLSTRALAWRVDAEFLLVFLALRHAPLRPTALRRIVSITIGVAVFVSAIALFEFFAPHAWNRFLVSVAQIPIYKERILHVAANQSDVLTHGVVAGHKIIRVGSTLLSPLTVGFFLYCGWALSLRLMSGRRVRPGIVVAATVIGMAIVVTLTRSAILGALLIGLVSLTVGAARLSPGRIRLGIVLVAAAIVVTPIASVSTVGQRLSETLQGTDVSTTGHFTALHSGVNTLVHHPLGQGLGSGPGIGARFDVHGRVTAEDYYLGLGDEAGLAAMLLFIAIFFLLIRSLRRRVRAPGRIGSFAGSLYAAAIGYAFGCLFLHVWIDFTVALTFWALAGIALNPCLLEPEPLRQSVEVRRLAVGVGVG